MGVNDNMADISIDTLVRCLTGEAQSGDRGLIYVSPAVRRALAQQLRERIDRAAGSKDITSEPGDDALAETMRLAAYLDGQMAEQEKASFENDLALSCDRRNALISAVAWLDAVDAQQISAPAHLIDQAIALETSSSTVVAKPWLGRVAKLIASLVPRNRWALATSGAAAIVVLAIGLPLVRQQAPEPSTARPVPRIDVAELDKPNAATDPALPPAPAPMAATPDERKEVRREPAERDSHREPLVREDAAREQLEKEQFAVDQAERKRLDQARIEQARLALEEAERKALEVQRPLREAARREPARSVASAPPTPEAPAAPRLAPEKAERKEPEQLARALTKRESATLRSLAPAAPEGPRGPDHSDTADSLNELAIGYQAQGKYVEAERLYRQALATGEKARGRDHPDVALTLIGLAMVYERQGRYAEAEGLYRRALGIREKALGKDRPDVAQTSQRSRHRISEPGQAGRGGTALSARPRHQ